MGNNRTTGWKKRLGWVKRTLTGYTVVFVNVDYEHIVKHRPFRSPIMKSTRMTKNKLKGKSYSMLVYDEISEWPPSPTEATQERKEA